MKHIKLFESYNQLDRLIQIRMDKIFDTVEEYKTKHKIDCEIKDINFGDYEEFSRKHLIEITDFVDEINRRGTILVCDFPTFFISSMSELESGEGLEVGELEIYEAPININYSYTHVYNPFTKKPPYKWELEDRYRVKYEKTTDELSSHNLLELMTTGAHHSEHGVIGLDEESIKSLIRRDFGGY